MVVRFLCFRQSLISASGNCGLYRLPRYPRGPTPRQTLLPSAAERRFRSIADLAADLVGPDINFHSGTLNYLHTEDAGCGLSRMVISWLIFDLWRGSTLLSAAHIGLCCDRILPETKTVGQALSSQNVSNRTTS